MAKKPVIYAWIFARGGSKGCPGKNIRAFNGKPLIAYAIEVGLKSQYIEKVFVSTDDIQIANVARQYGAIVPFLRPKELAQDDSREHFAWQHATRWASNPVHIQPMDIMVSLPTTAPLRKLQDIDQGIKLFLEGKADTVIAITPSSHHPCFNMVKKDSDGVVSLLDQNNSVTRRQDTLIAYQITPAFYITSSNFIMNSHSIWEGKTIGMEIEKRYAWDIDTELDFIVAEKIMQIQEND